MTDTEVMSNGVLAGEEIDIPLTSAEAVRTAKQEVVKFCEEVGIAPSFHDYCIVGDLRQEEELRKDCRLCAWQKKLKEWGID